MDFNHGTDSAKDSPTREPDTALSAVIIIAAMISVGCLKCFSQPHIYADFCPQFNANLVGSPLFPHLSAHDK